MDVSLAISSGLLNVLSQLCGTETMLGQPLQLLQKPGVSQLSTALKVASTRLLQILAISTGYEGGGALLLLICNCRPETDA